MTFIFALAFPRDTHKSSFLSRINITPFICRQISPRLLHYQEENIGHFLLKISRILSLMSYHQKKNLGQKSYKYIFVKTRILQVIFATLESIYAISSRKRRNEIFEDFPRLEVSSRIIDAPGGVEYFSIYDDDLVTPPTFRRECAIFIIPLPPAETHPGREPHTKGVFQKCTVEPGLLALRALHWT